MTRTAAAAALTLLLAALGGWFLLQPAPTAPGDTALSDRLVGAAIAQEAEVDTSTIEEMRLGDADAPVTVIEYASFTCPHCARFHEESFDKLKAEYIDTGKVNFIYREVYFDRYGLWASAVARCAGPEKFFALTDMIYDQQSEWARAGDGAAIAEALRKMGLVAGLRQEQIEGCLMDGEKLRTLVAWFEENAKEHGIEATPSFVIDGTTHRNMAWDELSALIDAAM